MAQTNVSRSALNVALARAHQVVVIAAGYDSRSWRMACAGVTFFEVDQPATQADKRAKAPEGGPVYVTADHRPPAADELAEVGFRSQEPTAFTVEGLTTHFPNHQVGPTPSTACERRPGLAETTTDS
jgi:methyltransferase (TIGR00027 family)